jgi:hypothetical protein
MRAGHIQQKQRIFLLSRGGSSLDNVGRLLSLARLLLLFLLCLNHQPLGSRRRARISFGRKYTKTNGRPIAGTVMAATSTKPNGILPSIACISRTAFGGRQINCRHLRIQFLIPPQNQKPYSFDEAYRESHPVDVKCNRIKKALLSDLLYPP